MNHLLPQITQLVTLRALEPEDAELLCITENDTEAWADSDTVAPLSRHTLLQYALTAHTDPLQSGQMRLVVELAHTRQAVGLADLYGISPLHRHAWAAIYILPQYRRQRLATAALRALALHAHRHLGLQHLGAKILSSNTASQRLFSHCGYTHAGTLPQWRFANAHLEDLLIYTASI